MSREPFVSHAQHGEDVVLWRALGSHERVNYVNVGGSDPTHGSPTRALYDRGWRGVNIEAQPDRLDALKEGRPEDINILMAAGDTDGQEIVGIPDSSQGAVLERSATVEGVNTANPETVEVRRLASVFHDLGLEQVDLLLIDGSGTEAGVVRGLLAGEVRPSVCLVRGVGPGLDRRAGAEAVALLVEAGYHHCMFDGLNHFLTTDEKLGASLSVPANPFDGFVTDVVDRLSRERESLTASLAALARENLALRRGAEMNVGLIPQVRPPRSVDPSTLNESATRAKRRRATMERILAGSREEPLAIPPRVEVPWIVQLHSGAPTPKDVVDLLYHGVLGRAPDPGGLTAWTARVENGDSLFDLASEMAASDEACARPAVEQAMLQADLRTWERLLVADALGLGAWHALGGKRAANASQRIFVDALFEVAMQRSPRPRERAREVDKLGRVSQ